MCWQVDASPTEFESQARFVLLNETIDIMELFKKRDIWIGCSVFLIINGLGVLNSIQVTFHELQSETKDDWKWFIYLFFPISLIYLYILSVSYSTFYYFWHQIWSSFWSGLSLIILALTLDFNNVDIEYINTVLLIFGAVFMMISPTFPFIAYYQFKKTKEQSTYHRLKAINSY